MVSDIVKQIILKFKAEGGPEVQRQIEQMTKVGGLRPRDVDRTLQNMNKINKALSTAGIQVSGEFNKVKKVFEELNHRQVEQFSKKIERVTKLMQKQTDELKRLEEIGAPEARVRAQMNRIARSNQLFNQMAQNAPTVRPTLVQQARGMGIMGATGAISGALAWGGQMANEYGEFLTQRAQNRQTLASFAKNQNLQYYGGNLEQSILANQGVYQKAQTFAQQRTRAETVKQSLWGGAGLAMAGGGLLALALAPFTGGSSLLGYGAMLGMAGGGLAMAGGGGRLAYFFGHGRRAYEQRQYQEQVERLKSETLTPEQYQYFQRHERNRMMMVNQFGVSSQQLYNFRLHQGYTQLYGEQEAMGTLQGFRRFGNANAFTLAGATMAASRQQGTSLQEASRQMSAVALNAVGGSKQASKNLKEVMSVGVASGIKDSGMLDNFKDLTNALLQQVGTRMDASKISEVIARSVQHPSLREMQMLPGAYKGIGALLGGAGGTNLDRQIMFNAGLQVLAKQGVKGPAAVSMADMLSKMTFQEGMAGGSKMLQQATGMSAAQIKNFYVSQLKSRAMRYTEGRADLEPALGAHATKSQLARGALYLSSMYNLPYDQAMQAIYSLRGNIPGAGGTAGSKALGGETLPEILHKGSMFATRTIHNLMSSPEAKAEHARVTGTAALDIDTQKKIAENMDQIMKTYNDTVVKNYEKVGTEQLGKSVDNIVGSLNKLEQALNDAASTISGHGSHTFVTPTNNRAAH